MQLRTQTSARRRREEISDGPAANWLRYTGLRKSWARILLAVFFFSSRRRHTRWTGDWSSDVCSSDLESMTNWTEKKAFGASNWEGRRSNSLPCLVVPDALPPAPVEWMHPAPRPCA